MKNFYIAITFLCAALLALLVMIACALEPDMPEEPQAIAPEVNAEGLCSVTAVRAPEYEMYFTEADVTALARMLYGEARGCTVDNQMKCVWCVLNRVDDVRFPDSIIGVVSAPGQFYGYIDGLTCVYGPCVDCTVPEDFYCKYGGRKEE